MDEVLEYNRKTLTDVYMTEVRIRTVDVEAKVNFLRDQLTRNENKEILQQEVDSIKGRGRILKEQVDMLATEFETKYCDLKAARTEHLKTIEVEYCSFLLKLKSESEKCHDICKSGNLQEVEGVIKSLDELLNHTNLSDIEIKEDYFEPVQTGATQLKDLFGEICSKDIPIPDRSHEHSVTAVLPDVDMADDSDIASLLDSEPSPKPASTQEDEVSEKSLIHSEASAKSYHDDESLHGSEHEAAPKPSSTQEVVDSEKSLIHNEASAKSCHDDESIHGSEHGAAPKSASVHEDIDSQENLTPFEVRGKDFDDADDKGKPSVHDSSIKSEISAKETDSDNLHQLYDKSKSMSDNASESEKSSIQVKVISKQEEIVSDREKTEPVAVGLTSDEPQSERSSRLGSAKSGRQSVIKSDVSAVELVDDDVTDTSQVLEKEDDKSVAQDTEDDVESVQSKYSYATSYEDAASSKSTSLPKSRDAADIGVKTVEKDVVEPSHAGDSDPKSDGLGSGISVKGEEPESEQGDSSLMEAVSKPVEEEFIESKEETPLGEEKTKFTDAKSQKDHFIVTKDDERETLDTSLLEPVSAPVPIIDVSNDQNSEAAPDRMKMEVLRKSGSKEYPKEKVPIDGKVTEVSKRKSEETREAINKGTGESLNDMHEREELRRSSLDTSSDDDGGHNVPGHPAPAGPHDILDILHTFKVRGGDEVISICPMSSGQSAWITRQKGKHVFRAIKMVSRSGKVVQTSGFPRAVVDISTDRSDGLLVTCTDSVVRQMLAVDKSVVKFETDDDLTSLCQLNNGNIVVCHYLTSKVALLDQTGGMLGCLDGRGRDRPIIGNPWKVRVNENNDDIVIINRQGPPSIVVADKDLRFRFLFDGKFTYTAANIHDFNSSGSPREQTSATTSGSICDSRFIPVDACFDSSGNIIIAEYNRKAVLVLDADGCLVGTLYNECTRPTSLALDSQGHLWVGYVNGKIDIIRHLSEKINWLK